MDETIVHRGVKQATDNAALAPKIATSMPAREPRTIQSVDRALDLLDTLASASGELTLSDIAARTGLNASTCHHLLATLARRGYVGQTPPRGGYFLGPRITELSELRIKQFSLVDLAIPALKSLNETTKESVHLAVLQGRALVTLAKLDSLQPVRVASDDTAKANAAHATATGKAILAWLPEAEIARVIAETGLARFTEKTISSIAVLMEELRMVRRNGYALDDEEFQPGVFCIGTAVRDHAGAVIGSISCSMPKSRVDGVHDEQVKSAVKTCAEAISERFGKPKDPEAA